MKTVTILTITVLLAACDQSPEAKAKSNARHAIKQCWSEQEKKSNSPSQAQFVAGACEMMERQFTEKYQTTP
jgi:hypothetical protein